MKINECFYAAAILILSAATLFSQTTVEQFLEVVRNDAVNGGEFHVAIKVKGSNLHTANSLGSATIDIVYDHTQLAFDSGTFGVIAVLDGYNSFFSDNLFSLRFGVTGNLVYPGAFAAHDLSPNYEIFGTAQFTILDDQVLTTLSILETTNQIGLFDSHSNDNGSGVIINQTLNPPININEEPLPVELVSFSANHSGKTVMIEWATATENNNYGFEIERKLYGSTSTPLGASWVKLGFVTGAGNSIERTNYQYSDENLNSDHYFYRLKQIDYNGAFAYSNEVEVKFELIVDDFTLTQNYPNPFNPSTQIKFGFKESTHASLRVYSTIGELVSELFNAKAEAGNVYTVTFNADNLPSGMYLYELRGNNSVELKKMLLLK